MAADAVAARARGAVEWARTDEAAGWAFRAAVLVSLIPLYVAGRHQWFIRDDWAFIVTRTRIRDEVGAAEWLFTPQDGHWMTVPILVYRAVEVLFGLSSYWPFLLTALVPHVVAVLLVRVLCRRVGASEWTTTQLCAILLVFGAGWENIVFGIQLTYNIALVGFLVQLLLTDHDGPVDRRDLLGLGAGAIAVMSSGFGPFFVIGVAVALTARQRWRAAVVASAPLAALFVVWWLAHGSDVAADNQPGGKSQVPAFAARGLSATFDGLVPFAALGGIALFAALAVTVWLREGRPQPLLVALAVTAIVMFVGVGVQRVGLGLQTAAASRYVYMGAILLVPALAVAVDRLRLVAPPALTAGRLVLATSLVINTGTLLAAGSSWARRSSCEREILELLAGSPAAAAADPLLRPIPFSPDIQLRDLPRLIADDAFAARPVVDERQQAIVDEALAGSTTLCVPAA